MCSELSKNFRFHEPIAPKIQTLKNPLPLCKPNAAITFRFEVKEKKLYKPERNIIYYKK